MNIKKENKVMRKKQAGKDVMLMWAEGLRLSWLWKRTIKARDWIAQFAFYISLLPYMITQHTKRLA